MYLRVVEVGHHARPQRIACVRKGVLREGTRGLGPLSALKAQRSHDHALEHALSDVLRVALGLEESPRARGRLGNLAADELHSRGHRLRHGAPGSVSDGDGLPEARADESPRASTAAAARRCGSGAARRHPPRMRARDLSVPCAARCGDFRRRAACLS